MKHARSLWMQTALAFALVLSFSPTAVGQQAAIVPARITQPVDMERLVTLRGNTHPLARPEFDQGAAPDSLPMERILLVLQRSQEQETALRKLLDEQQIKSSPNYHMWLTPEQFGQQFGPADADIQAVTDWLASQGFQVNRVAAGRTVIEFSGTAGALRQAFRTEIHKFMVKGEEHWANASDPQIPAALTPVVAGFASLNNFPRKPMYRRLGTFSRAKATGEVRPLFSLGSNSYAVGPTDFATIYNVSPLWTAGIDGTGQTIAIVAQTNINIQDVQAFRTMFNVQPVNNLPAVILNGPDPGMLSGSADEGESDLDVEWAGAVAPGATVDLVVSQGTEVTYGIDLSALYIIDNNLAPVMSESYGGCEAALGSGALAFYSTLWEQGAAQGITILEAAGDTGSAGCDDYPLETAASYGLAVSGLASTSFNVAVGGTDFNDVNNWSKYWYTTNNSTTLSSAIKYIPEMTWNDTCANTANTGQLNGCASAGSNTFDVEAGGGGPSAVYTRPPWQTGPPSWVFSPDGARDTPDVSLFAAIDSSSGSFYAMCEADALQPGEPSCDLNATSLYFLGAGGTSASVQSFAGIMALVNQMVKQKTGVEGQGNANYVLYPMAAQAYTANNGTYCTSSQLPSNPGSCIFYDVTSGNISVACVGGSANCSSATGYGIMVNPSNTAQPAWLTTAGYDLATGLGTVNVANLVNKWTSVSFASTTTTLTGLPTTPIAHGTPVTVTIQVTSPSGTPTGDVSLIAQTSGIQYSSTSSVAGFSLPTGSGTVTGSTNMLPGGTYNVTAHYAGNGTYGASDSTPPVQVTVSPESSKTFVALVTYDPATGQVTNRNATAVMYGSACLLRVDVTNSSGNVCYNASTGVPTYQCPTGQVVVTNNGGLPTDVGAPADNSPGTYTLNSQGYTEDQFIQLPVGTDVLVANYVPHPIAPNNSYNASTSAADTITVTQAATATTVSPSTNPVPYGANVTLTATVNTTSFGLAPTGTVTFYNGSKLISGTPAYTSANASATGYASLTATLTTTFTANATITAQYSGDTNYQGSTSPAVSLTVSSGPDFNLTYATSITVTSPGQYGTTTISAGPLNGFSGTVNVTCSLPSTMTYSSCSFSSASFSVPGGSTTLTVNTTAPSTALRRFNGPGWFIPSAGALFACILLLFMSAKKRRAKLAFGLLVFALLAAALVACGGSSSSPSPSNPGTPTGNYTVTVTGSATISGATVSHNLLVPVAVQ